VTTFGVVLSDMVCPAQPQKQ